MSHQWSEPFPETPHSRSTGPIPFLLPAIYSFAGNFLCLGFILLLATACTSNPPTGSSEKGKAEPAQSNESPSELDWTSVPFSYSVTESRGYAFLGLGDALLVIDVSSPAQPLEVGSIKLKGPIRDILVSDNVAYVAGSSSGLHIVDVAEPDNPRLLNSIPSEDRFEAVDLAGTTLYAAAGTSGLIIFDISNPGRPRQLGSYSTLEEAMDVKVKDSLALVAASFGGLRIVDVANPQEPEEIGFATRGSYDQGYAWSVAVQDDYAYVANVEIGLRSVDISEPAEAQTEGLYGLATYVDKPYAPVSVAVEGRYVYLADQAAGLRIVDVSDPEEMEEVSELDLPGHAMDVEIRDKLAYVASRTGGLRIIDVSNTKRPAEVGFYDPTVIADDVYSTGNRNFVIDRNRLIREVDIENLAAPAQVNQYAVRVDEMTGSGGYLYLADSGTVKVIRAQAAEPMEAVASLSLPFVVDLSTEDNFLYALNDEGVVLRIDISQAEHPRPSGQFDVLSAWNQENDSNELFLSTEVRILKVKDSRLHVTVDDQMLTFDVSDWDKPEFIGAASIQGKPLSIWVEQNNLFILTDTTLFLFDLSQQHPRVPVASTRIRALSGFLLPARKEVWIAKVQGGIRGYRYGSGETLVEIGSVDFSYRITGMAFSRSRLLLASGEGGLRILDIEVPASPQLVAGWTSTRNHSRSRADGNQMAATPRSLD